MRKLERSFITIITPNIVSQKNDVAGSGIPYVPISAIYTATYLKSKGFQVKVIDSFGENPWKVVVEGDFLVQGLGLNEIVKKVPKVTKVILTYAAQVITHSVHLRIIKRLKEEFPKVPIVVMENSQSVVAYSLENNEVVKDFFKAGVDFIVVGEGEERCLSLIRGIKNGKIGGIDGLIYKKGGKIIKNRKNGFILDLDKIPFPDWSLIPIENYWKIGYAHAPVEGRYLPILSSRGCPGNCEFCIIPKTNSCRWRARSAKNVVDEIENNLKTLRVKEYHFEDLNPTVSKDRMIEISKEILNRELKVIWKFAAGTKIETLDEKTMKWMVRAGCRYISISPESGSNRVLSLMKKHFDHKHALRMIKLMDELEVTSQACFVLGFYGENANDKRLTCEYVKEVVKAGIDEVALFIMAPLPGARAFAKEKGYKGFSQITFSPIWRERYGQINKYRWTLFLKFVIWQIIYYPKKVFEKGVAFLTRKFKTKIEMTLWRIIKIRFWCYKNKFNK